MRQYISFLRLAVMKGLQYRVAAIAGVFTQFFFGFIFIMIFEAFYAYSNVVQPIQLTQLIQMVWLQQAFLVFIMLWHRDSELYNMIVSGNIAYELCRPTNLYHYWYARLLGSRLAGAILRCLPIIILALFMPEPYRLYPPENISVLLLFIATLTGAVLITVCISMFIYISIFYTLSPTGSFLVAGILGEFFAGLIIPIPLMPKALQTLTAFLPFRYFGDLPFRIYSGNIPLQDGIEGFMIQMIWIGILSILGNRWMKTATKRVVVHGG